MKSLIIFLMLLVFVQSIIYCQYKIDEIIYEPERVRMNDVAVFSENAAVAVGQFGIVRIMTDKANVNSYVYLKEKKELFSVVYLSANNLVTVGSDGLIYKSQDGGKSWEKVVSPTDNTLYSVYFLNDTIGFAAGAKGTIIKTTNGGNNWKSMKSNVNSDLYGISATDLNSIFAAGSNGTVIQSDNYGEKWEKHNMLSNVNFQHVKAIGLDRVFVMGDSLKVYIYDNYMKNWYVPVVEPKYNKLYIKPQIISCYFKDENNGVITVIDNYSCSAQNYEYYTTNGGNNWTSVDLWANMFGSSTPTGTVCMDFANDDFGILFDVSGDLFIEKYTNKLQHKLKNIIYGNRFNFLNSNKNQFVAIYDYGSPSNMILSENYGENWVKSTSVDSIKIFKYSMDYAGVSIPKKDAILLSVNDAYDTIWTEGSTIHIVTIKSGLTLKSDDFGKSWNPFIIPNHEPAYETDFFSDDYGLLRIAYKYNYMVTKDGGNTWKYIPFPDTARISRITSVICQSPQLHLIVASINDSISKAYRIYDEGKNWDNDIVLPPYHTKIKYINESLMFAFGNQSFYRSYSILISKSTDGGITWKKCINEPILDENRFINYAYYDENNFMVNTDGFFYMTHDGGIKWDKIPLNMIDQSANESVSGVVYLNPNKLVVATYMGRMFYYTDNTFTSVNNFDVKSPNSIIYPNPAKDYIEIKPSEGWQPSEGSLIQIFSTFGETLLTVEQTSPSVQKIDISKLFPGIYFIKIGNRLEKFVKI